MLNAFIDAILLAAALRQPLRGLQPKSRGHANRAACTKREPRKPADAIGKGCANKKPLGMFDHKSFATKELRTSHASHATVPRPPRFPILVKRRQRPRASPLSVKTCNASPKRGTA